MFSATSILPRQQGAGDKLWTIDEVGISIRSLVLRRRARLSCPHLYCIVQGTIIQISTRQHSWGHLAGACPAWSPLLIWSKPITCRCNGPRSTQHGASCLNTVAMGRATHILGTNNSYWLCCCKIENIHNSKQNIKADPNMSSAQWALLIAHEMAQRRTKWRESTSWTSLTCHVVDMLDLVDRVADSLDVVDIADH